MKTFLTTYQSFTTPTKLFEKLIQRYPFFFFCSISYFFFSFNYKLEFTFNYPMKEKDKDKEKSKQIQLRVAIVFKHWIESQFKDFDDSLIQKMFDFFENDLKTAHEELATILKKELQRLVAERSAHLQSVLSDPPADITVKTRSSYIF